MFYKIKLFFLLRINKNYNKVIKKNELYKIRKLKSDLAGYQISDIASKFSKDFEISVRQYLFQKLLGQLFLKQLFFFNQKKILFPIPNEWNEIFGKNFFKVSRVSNYLFRLFLVYQIYNGISFIIKVLIEYFKKKNKTNLNKSDIILHNISNKHLKYISSNSDDFNILFWLKKKFPNKSFFFVNKTDGKDKNNNLNYLNYFFSNIINDLDLIKFIKLSLKVIVESFFHLFTNKWSKTLMTEEILKKILVKSIKNKKENFPEKNIFIYIANIYRPLWTYEVEKFSEIILQCTSELSDTPLVTDEYSKIYDFRGYNMMTWPNINVWTNKNYLEFKKVSPKINVSLSDPITIIDKQFNPIFSNRVIALFAYFPDKGNYGIAQMTDYVFKPDNKNFKFFKDIISLSNKYNFNIFIKYFFI